MKNIAIEDMKKEYDDFINYVNGKISFAEYLNSISYLDPSPDKAIVSHHSHMCYLFKYNAEYFKDFPNYEKKYIRLLLGEVLNNNFDKRVFCQLFESNSHIIDPSLVERNDVSRTNIINYLKYACYGQDSDYVSVYNKFMKYLNNESEKETLPSLLYGCKKFKGSKNCGEIDILKRYFIRTYSSYAKKKHGIENLGMYVLNSKLYKATYEKFINALRNDDLLALVHDTKNFDLLRQIAYDYAKNVLKYEEQNLQKIFNNEWYWKYKSNGIYKKNIYGFCDGKGIYSFCYDIDKTDNINEIFNKVSKYFISFENMKYCYSQWKHEGLVLYDYLFKRYPDLAKEGVSIDKKIYLENRVLDKIKSVMELLKKANVSEVQNLSKENQDLYLQMIEHIQKAKDTKKANTEAVIKTRKENYLPLCRELLKLFLDFDVSIDEFLEIKSVKSMEHRDLDLRSDDSLIVKGFNRNDFRIVTNIVSELDPELYSEYINKMIDKRNKRFAIICSKSDIIIDLIENGVVNPENDDKRDFDPLDYYIKAGSLDPGVFLGYVEKYKSDDYKTVKEFFETKKIDYINNQKSVVETEYIVNNEKVSKLEKEKLMNYLKSINAPINDYFFTIALNRYKENNINLDNNVSTKKR